MPSSLRLSITAVLVLHFVAAATAETSFEKSATKLSAATVTVRMQSFGERREHELDPVAPVAPDADEKLAKNQAAKSAAKNNEPNPESNADSKDAAHNGGIDAKLDAGLRDERSNPRRRYTIASGVCVGENLIVTAMRPEKESAFRITLPGGARCDAELCVVDKHSSLVLLAAKVTDTTTIAIAPLAISAEPPKLGGRLLAASAWGSEPPSVSQGVVGGVDRFIPSSLLPPLLQCDVQTTETSRGAGVVNAAGELVGIVVAFDGENRRSNWTYLVSGEHVARLLAARKEGQIVELPRRVAHAGMDLRQIAGSDTLVIRRVAAGGAAEKAGIREGDELRSLDGNEMHSPFAAARTVASRRPGDKIDCVVRRGEQELTFSLTLEESAEEPTISFTQKAGEEKHLADRNRARQEHRERSNPDEARPESELPEPDATIRPEIKPAANPKARTPVEIDTLESLREHLKEQDALIKRLEAELAELKRERDRIKAQPAGPTEPPMTDGKK